VPRYVSVFFLAVVLLASCRSADEPRAAGALSSTATVQKDMVAPSAGGSLSSTATAQKDMVASRVIDLFGPMIGASRSTLAVSTIQEVQWDDTCLGAARPKLNCQAQKIPGYKLVVVFRGEAKYEIRTDRNVSQVVWLAPDQAQGEISDVISRPGSDLIVLKGEGPAFDRTSNPGFLQLATFPGSEFLTPRTELSVGRRVAFGYDGIPSSDVGALVWIAAIN